MEKSAVPSQFIRHFDGSASLTNFVFADDGAVVRKEADMNAVVVQLIEAPQEDGTMLYRRLVSVICKDPELLEPLQEEARRLLR